MLIVRKKKKSTYLQILLPHKITQAQRINLSFKRKLLLFLVTGHFMGDYLNLKMALVESRTIFLST